MQKSTILQVSYIGIFLIAFGTGGIKPCVVSLGADQFKVTSSLTLLGVPGTCQRVGIKDKCLPDESFTTADPLPSGA